MKRLQTPLRRTRTDERLSSYAILHSGGSRPSDKVGGKGGGDGLPKKIFLPLVVSKMGIPGHTLNYQKCIKKTNKIPDYARDYKNEYLFIRGINKECEKFVKKIKENEEFYNSSKAIRIIRKIKRLGYFNNISKIYFEIDDVKNIEFIHTAIEEYRDLYCNPYTGGLNEEVYKVEAEVDNPGFRSFYKHFCRFYDELLIVPDYARDYKNEYLFIRGINKECGDFVKLIKENEEFYNSSKALRIIRKIKKLKSLGYFKNISRIKFEIEDVENIDFIHTAIEEYRDLYCNPYTGVLNEEVYNIEAEVDNPGFKSFYKHFCRFYDELLNDEYYY